MFAWLASKFSGKRETPPPAKAATRTKDHGPRAARGETFFERLNAGQEACPPPSPEQEARISEWVCRVVEHVEAHARAEVGHLLVLLRLGVAVPRSTVDDGLKITPFSRAMATSFARRFPVWARRTSPVARPRTTMADDWIPAFPPIAMIIGMKNAAAMISSREA